MRTKDQLLSASTLVSQIVDKDFTEAKKTFVSLLHQKSFDKLEERKIRVASRMFESTNVHKATDDVIEESGVSDLDPIQQFTLINDYLGIRQYSGVRHFRTDPDRAKKIIDANKVDTETVKAAIEKMKQHKEIDRSFNLKEETLDEENNFQKGANVKVKSNVYDSIGKKYLDEAAKEMTMKQVMQKIKDGYWTTDEDLKVGKHVTLHDHKGKRFVVYITSDELDEAAKEMTMKQVMQKIKDGYWETDEDLKVGKHVTMHDHKGKKFVVYITSDKKTLDEEKILSEASLGSLKKYDKTSRDFYVNGVQYWATGKKANHRDGGAEVREFEPAKDKDKDSPTLWVDVNGKVYADAKSDESRVRAMLA